MIESLPKKTLFNEEKERVKTAPKLRVKSFVCLFVCFPDRSALIMKKLGELLLHYLNTSTSTM